MPNSSDVCAALGRSVAIASVVTLDLAAPKREKRRGAEKAIEMSAELIDVRAFARSVVSVESSHESVPDGRANDLAL